LLLESVDHTPTVKRYTALMAPSQAIFRLWSRATVALAYASRDASTITIGPASSIWVLDPIDAGYAARTPLALALRDVQVDWYKVFGTRPAVIVGALPDDFAGTAVYFGRAARALSNATDTHSEAHAIIVSGNNIISTGNGERGEVYAAYAFSEHVLGVQPLWWWTDMEPVYKGYLTLNVSDIAVEYGAPMFQWRGWFPNDEVII
jgi:hypothetical protein